MLNNDQRSGLAKEARRTYTFAPMSLDVNGARHDWLAVVDYLWQEFDRMTTPRSAVMRDLEVAREAAEQYRRDAVDAALRLGRIRKTLDD